MSIVFGPDAFTVGSDIGIVSYSSASYVYVTGFGATTDITVNAANDRVQQNSTGDMMVRIKASGVPTTGVGLVSAVLSSEAAADSAANLCVRMKTDDTANSYMMYMNRAGGNVAIYRIDGGSFVSLTGDVTRALGASHTVTLKAVTNGSQVDLTGTISGLADVTVSDTNALRKLDGTPGMHFFAGNANVAWLDDLSVDDLAAGGSSFTPLVGAAAFAGAAPTDKIDFRLSPATTIKI